MDRSPYPNVIPSSATTQAAPASTFYGNKGRVAKTKSTRLLSRSVSTPQLRHTVMTDSESDKKRNKLGYQRISVACAHCRRRKIRCVVAEEDPHQRCQNCIRLKKECVFYPVDQQSALENRSEPSNRSGADSGPSTPQIGGAERPFEPLPHFHAVPSNASASFQGLSLEPVSTLPVQGFVPSDHSYRPPDDIPMSWNAAGGMGAEHMPVLTSTPQEFWRYNQLRAPGDFSPYSSASTPRTPHFAPGAQNVAFAEQQRPSDSQPWPPHVPPPPRSVSYSHVENLRGTAFHTTPYHPDFRAPHVPSQHHLHHQQQHIPSPLDMSASLTSSTGPHSAPVGAQQHPPPYAQQHQTPYVLSPEQQQQQQQNPLHAPPPFPPHPNYPGTWYPHPSSFPPLEEDEPEQQPPPPLDYGAASRPRRSGP